MVKMAVDSVNEQKVTEGLPRWLLQYIGEVISHAGYDPKSDADLSDCLLGATPAESNVMTTPLETAIGWCEAAALVVKIQDRTFLDKVAASLPFESILDHADEGRLILLLLPWKHESSGQAVQL